MLNTESVGGNAGRNQIAINAVVSRHTGEVRAFGNPQVISRDILQSPENAEVTFVYEAGNAVQRILGRADTFEPGYFAAVRAGGCSDTVIQNLNEAMERFNTEHKEAQKQQDQRRIERAVRRPSL